MKRFLTYLNLFLGVASLALAGCHSQKNAAKSETPAPTQKEAREPELICMYGVPTNIESEKPDTARKPRPQPEGRIMLKYGVPNPPAEPTK
ncbi:MAG: hypothetical protein K6A36_06450 [Paludibacteraceae bacterium]|nr:hypothetical protein [Paludibacteraceae bacterium]